MIPTLLTVVLSASVACSNTNWQHSERCTAPVDYFMVNEDGSAWGALTSGVTFTQSNIINNHTKLQVFRAEDAYWYVSDKGIIYADTDMEALSIYLSR